MTPVAVAFKTEDDLIASRDELVQRSGLTLEELKRRGRTYDVTVEQRNILESIEDIEYLLADD